MLEAHPLRLRESWNRRSRERRTSRIRRRRAQDVADTTDSLRAIACIRFALGCGVVTACHAVLCAGTILAEPLLKESN